MAKRKDAEAELNLPPGFRFHPTDEELVVHYLCRRAAHRRLPVPIIADVDLYKHDPWHLPERALFGSREWYFFTPRERKYPKGSRPNRAAGSGYWKATGADRPVAAAAAAAGSARPLGIRKALVFYTGKAPRGVKTDWIMHEYRLAGTDRAVDQKGSGGGASLRLDDWVLCRLYNKKNNWPGKAAPPHQAPVTGPGEDAPFFEPRDGALYGGFRTLDRSSDGHAHRHFSLFPPERLAADSRPPVPGGGVAGGIEVEDNCLRDLNLDGMASSSAAAAAAFAAGVASTSLSYQDYLAAIAAPAKLRTGHGSSPPF